MKVEIEMIVIATAGVELRPASRALGLTPHVLENGQLCTAGAAKNRFPVPFILGPHFDFVTGKGGVTILAGIVDSAALHLDRDNVGGAAIVLATGLRIEIDATHVSEARNHCAIRNT